MWRLLSYLKPYSRTLLPAAFIAVLISAVVRLVTPILIGKYTLDYAIANKDTELLIILVTTISCLYLVSYIANTFRIRWMNMLGQM